VQAIEAGELDAPATEHMLRGWLEPMLAQGMDELVLACTHYPLVRPLIERICGPDVGIIDPAPAVAKRVGQVLDEHQLLADLGKGDFQLWTSRITDELPIVLELLDLPRDYIAEAQWEIGMLNLR
jgi:glutamate racemase